MSTDKDYHWSKSPLILGSLHEMNLKLSIYRSVQAAHKKADVFQKFEKYQKLNPQGQPLEPESSGLDISYETS